MNLLGPLTIQAHRGIFMHAWSSPFERHEAQRLAMCVEHFEQDSQQMQAELYLSALRVHVDRDRRISEARKHSTSALPPAA
jgi:hypothetical protein